MGGWIQLCETLLTKDAPFKQKEFERYYLYYLNHKDVLEASISFYLTGNTEIGLRNFGSAQDVTPPICIEKEKTRMENMFTKENQQRFLEAKKRSSIEYQQENNKKIRMLADKIDHPKTEEENQEKFNKRIGMLVDKVSNIKRAKY
jgi:hypothetical protein